MAPLLFALNGVTKPQPIKPFDYGFRYDPSLQMHVLDTGQEDQLVIDLKQGIHAFAKTQIDTWCRDPSDYNSKIKDDSDYVNTD